MKTVDFREVLQKELEEGGDCLKPSDRVRRFGATYCHYWEDGQIQRKDVYELSNKQALLESSWYRYELWERWKIR